MRYRATGKVIFFFTPYRFALDDSRNNGEKKQTKDVNILKALIRDYRIRLSEVLFVKRA